MRLLPLTLIAALSAMALPVLAQEAATPAPAASDAAAPAAPAAEARTPAVLPDMVMGAEDAPITLIEYASYTCGHCAHWEREIFPRLKMEYIDTGKVKFIHREVYFDKVGLWAGMLARCGGDDKYFAMSRMLYDQQQAWMGDHNLATVGDHLRKMGLKAGLTAEQIDACFADQVLAESMVMTFQETAVKDEINATPTMLINGEKVTNMPWEELKVILDKKLEG